MNPNVTVCLPAYGSSVTSYTTESLWTLAQWFTDVRIQSSLCWLDMNGIEDCRNTFLTIWYDHMPDSTHLLFVDADMKFSHSLIQDMLRFNQPVVGCLYSKRQMHPADAVGVVLNANETPADTVDGFLKVRAVGAGVLLIRRDAIKTMLEKLPDLIDDGPVEYQTAAPTLQGYGAKRYIKAFDKLKVDGHQPLSEDLAFCERWRQCGGDVWANVEHLIGHIGKFNFAIRYADTLELQEKANREKEKAAA